MSWASTMNDLANSWIAGAVFVVLVALRYALTIQSVSLEGARTLIFTGLADLFGVSKQQRSTRPANDKEPNGRPAVVARTPAEDVGRSILEFVDSALIAVVLVFLLIRPFVIQAFYIPSASMHNTLLEDDKILVNKFIYRLQPPHRGDVIVFRAPREASPDNQEKDFIKRLIGLPGDRVDIRNEMVTGPDGSKTEAGVLYRNGQRVDEPYLAEPMDPLRTGTYPRFPMTVPAGNVLAMGDNRNNSNDGRFWGPLPIGRIRGKAMVIFWPPSRMGVIH